MSQKIFQVAAEIFRADRQADEWSDKANSRFSRRLRQNLKSRSGIFS